MSAAALPAGVFVLERGWLSSNNVVIVGDDEAAVIDSGYWTHSAQTVELVARAARGRPLVTLVNTHLHSDHCGGNAALQARYPGVRTLIPPGQAEAVRRWDPVALSHAPTGQACPAFGFQGLLVPGTTVELARVPWSVYAAPGHDPHSVVLFDPQTRTLVSADALWENGFGIVFPELDGVHAFEEVRATLDLIEGLSPRLVIPGHGGVFTDVDGALERARSRLRAYVANPRRHASHAAKVLLKFKLLELQRVPGASFLAWAESTPYLRDLHDRFEPGVALREWVQGLLIDLAKNGALRAEGDMLLNA